MIIDLILDRKDGVMSESYQNGKIVKTLDYTPKKFYNDVMSYYNTMPKIVEPIATALDSGENKDVQRELSRYIDSQEYNPNIVDYIYSVNWI